MCCCLKDGDQRPDAMWLSMWAPQPSRLESVKRWSWGDGWWRGDMAIITSMSIQGLTALQNHGPKGILSSHKASPWHHLSLNSHWRGLLKAFPSGRRLAIDSIWPRMEYNWRAEASFAPNNLVKACWRETMLSWEGPINACLSLNRAPRKVNSWTGTSSDFPQLGIKPRSRIILRSLLLWSHDRASDTEGCNQSSRYACSRIPWRRTWLKTDFKTRVNTYGLTERPNGRTRNWYIFPSKMNRR